MHPSSVPRRLSATLCITGALAAGFAAATPFPALYNTEPDTRGPLPAAEAAAKFVLPDGFQAKLFASEPEVQNPIAMAWDGRGRLWIAENYTFAEAPLKYDMGLRDRILVFEDQDGDGQFDSRKVFTDEVQMLTSIEVAHGGVWAMCPPQLLFIPEGGTPDTAGAPEVVLDGFTIPDQSHHNFANGLRWGPDGWLYGRCGGTAPGDVGAPGTPDKVRIPLRGGMWRYHPKRRVFEALNAGTTNPWGHDWDKHGELFFVNTVNGHLWHSITGAHYVRSSTIDPTQFAYSLIDQHADHWHFDTVQGWTKSRDGAANSLGGGHAHIGALIYQGDNWPASFRDKLFTFNMHGLRANQEILERAGSGYVARHGTDFLYASDSWFRGLDLSCGPDGAVFAIDWSDTGECHERNGVHRTSGRIFKLQYGNPKPVSGLNLQKQSEAELAQLHSHPNEWHARMARRALVERSENGEALQKAEALLRAQFEEQPDPVLKLRALWTLFATGKLDGAFLEAQLSHPNEHIRTWAIRLLSDDWPLDTVLSQRPVGSEKSAPKAEILAQFNNLARTDSSALVRLALASTLQRLPLRERTSLACGLVAHPEDALDHNLPQLIWYGLIPLAEADPSALVRVAESCQMPLTLQCIARRLSRDLERSPAPVDALLQIGARSPLPFFADELTQGLALSLKAWRKAPKPPSWDAFAVKISENSDSVTKDRVRELSVVFGDGRALEEITAIARDKKSDLNLRKAALQTLIDNRPPNLREICESLLKERFLNPVAARGLALFDEPKIGEELVAAYDAFHHSERTHLFAALVSRASFAKALLGAIGRGKIPRTAISAFDARQIRSFEDPVLNELLKANWGEIRDSGLNKKELIGRFKTELTQGLTNADRAQGRVVFNTVCGACHMLYGEGGKVGPDLTGAGRDNLDYLLENIADPSAVVSADFRMTVVQLKDGRVLTGMLRDKTDRTLAVQTMTEKTTLERSDIASLQEMTDSLMPEGLLEVLTPAQRRDLIGYLIHKSQVPLPPGLPTK